MSGGAFHRVVGIDPGPTPGVVVLTTCDRRLVDHGVVQCSYGLLADVLRALDPHHAVIGIERFVTRGRASADQTVTRDQVGWVSKLYPQAAVRSASEVKPWATDARLDAAGLLEAVKGMRHAKDAARHALFAAVKADLLADPLSRAGGSL